MKATQTQTCIINGCARPHCALGACTLHYKRFAKRGSFDLPTTEDRFWAKVDKDGTGGCWLWTAGASHGYGGVRVDGRYQKAHRVAYELIVGPIPEGLELDHLCRVRNCVNPAHLEPVTHRENALRSPIMGGWHRGITHCLRGHPFDEANTYVYHTAKGGVGRACRECLAFRKRRARARAKAAQ